MSEYQSYEFRAIEKPLSSEIQAKLRRISSRGDITPTSFSNEYQWGNFKGDPTELMWDGFDVFAYFANWGHHWCMFKIPLGVLDDAAEKYGSEVLSVSESATHRLFDFCYEEEPPDYDYDEAWIGRLMGIRSELLAGDERPLMIGWLAGIWGFEDDDPVPPVPPGMADLSATQEELAEFLYVTDDLLAAVAERSGEAAPGPTPEQAAEWLAAQPAETKEAWLLRLLIDQPTHLGAELWATFRRSLPQPESAGEVWKVGELRAREESIGAERQRQAAEQAERARLIKEQTEREAREQHLNALVGKEAALRKQVMDLTGTTLPKNYDEAVRIMLDLQELATRSGELSRYELWVTALRESRSRKPSLISRLDKAGL